MKTCNQCGEQLETLKLASLCKSIEIEIYACINEECSNWGLVQMPEEWNDWFNRRFKKNKKEVNNENM